MFSDNFANGDTNTSDTTVASKATNPILNHKRRNDLVDEAFLEQKDILLSMLENKLKEVRDKKKKKMERSDSSNKENIIETNKCEILPNNVDIKLKSNGIVGIGEADLQLKFADTGNNSLDLNATGISNVGKISVNLGMGDGSLQIPGLKNLFNGPCESQNQLESDKQNNGGKTDVIPIEPNRRNLEPSPSSVNETSSSVTNKTVTENDDKVDNTTQSLQENVTESVSSSTGNVDETTDM